MNTILKQALASLEGWVRSLSANEMAKLLHPGYYPHEQLRNMHQLRASEALPYDFLSPEQFTVTNNMQLRLVVEAKNTTCELRCVLTSTTDYGALGQIRPITLATISYKRGWDDLRSETVLDLLMQARTVLHQLTQLLHGPYSSVDLHDVVQHSTPTIIPSGPAAAVVHVVPEAPQALGPTRSKRARFIVTTEDLGKGAMKA